MKISFILIIVLLQSMVSAQEGFLRLEISPGIGYYLFPDKTSGNVDQYNLAYQRVLADATEGSPGYSQNNYKYEHAFPSSQNPNAGFLLGCMFMMNRDFGLGFEAEWGFSLSENNATHITVEEINSGNSYILNPGIPYDYANRKITSKDVLYIESISKNLAIGFSHPLHNKLNLYFGAGLGLVDYYQNFKIEYQRIEYKYYQANGNEVYSDTAQPYFSAFTINYTAYDFKPRVCLEYVLKNDIRFRAGLSCLLSLVNKGKDWHENSQSNYGMTFFPETRFFAGDLKLNIGIVFSLFKPKTDKEEQTPEPIIIHESN